MREEYGVWRALEFELAPYARCFVSKHFLASPFFWILFSFSILEPVRKLLGFFFLNLERSRKSKNTKKRIFVSNLRALVEVHPRFFSYSSFLEGKKSANPLQSATLLFWHSSFNFGDFLTEEEGAGRNSSLQPLFYGLPAKFR